MHGSHFLESVTGPQKIGVWNLGEILLNLWGFFFVCVVEVKKLIILELEEKLNLG